MCEALSCHRPACHRCELVQNPSSEPRFRFLPQSAGFHQAQAGGRIPGSGELFLVFDWAVWILARGHLKVIDTIKKSRRVFSSLPKQGPSWAHEQLRTLVPFLNSGS